jgi:hypothetical protein
VEDFVSRDGRRFIADGDPEVSKQLVGLVNSIVSPTEKRIDILGMILVTVWPQARLWFPQESINGWHINPEVLQSTSGLMLGKDSLHLGN